MRKPPETLDTACYTANRNRKGHRSPDQPDRFQAWTVSSCSPNVVVIPRGWLLLVGTGNLAGPTTDATVAQAPMSARQPDVAHACSVPCRHSWRHSAGIMPVPAPVQKTTGEEDQPLAAVFALLLRAAAEVQSTGARGASHKKKSK